MSKTFVQQPGKGTLMKNKYKQQPKHPDWMGDIKLDRDYKAGQVIKLAGWGKFTRGGEIIGLSISHRPDREVDPKEEAGDLPY